MSARKLLNHLRLGHLRQLCREEGIADTGGKQDVIERLEKHRETRVASKSSSSSGPTSLAFKNISAKASASASKAAAASPDDDPAPKATRGKKKIDKPDTATARAASGKEVSAEAAPRGRGRQKGTPSTPTSAKRLAREVAVVSSPEEAQRLVLNSAVKRVQKRRFSSTAGKTTKTTTLLCSKCGTESDFSIEKRASSDVGDSFLCMSCRAHMMDPFRPLASQHSSSSAAICDDGILYSSQVTNCIEEFTLDASDLRQWRKSGWQVELRMVRIPDKKVCHVWPTTMKVVIDNKEAFRVVKPEDGHKRRDIPQEISSSLAPGRNSVRLEIRDDKALKDFGYAVVLAAPCDDAQLSSRVRQCSFMDAHARVQDILSKAQKKARSMDDDDVTCLSVNSLKLTCPISMDRVCKPVRGEHCQHLQCFSLDAYLLSNRKMNAFNNRWVCPLCSLTVRPSDLRQDAYVEGILAKTGPDVEEVSLSPDGTWSCCATDDAADIAPSPLQEGDSADGSLPRSSSASAVNADDMIMWENHVDIESSDAEGEGGDEDEDGQDGATDVSVPMLQKEQVSTQRPCRRKNIGKPSSTAVLARSPESNAESPKRRRLMVRSTSESGERSSNGSFATELPDQSISPRESPATKRRFAIVSTAPDGLVVDLG